MLPRILCENLCSLNANVDRLAFSVVWTLDAEANILSEWFGRTVIRSCAKLAYGHAQEVIEVQAAFVLTWLCGWWRLRQLHWGDGGLFLAS